MDPTVTHIDCKFTSRIERDYDRYIMELPLSEIEHGTLVEGGLCQISIQNVENGTSTPGHRSTVQNGSQPPVSVGEQRTVTIEGIGDQGDGIARVGPGYVLIVPETEEGEEATVEIQETKPNYSFATVTDAYEESVE